MGRIEGTHWKVLKVSGRPLTFSLPRLGLLNEELCKQYYLCIFMFIEACGGWAALKGALMDRFIAAH